MAYVTDPYFIGGSAVYLVCVVLLIVALRGGWFNRLRAGYRWTLILAIALVGVGSTLVVSVWGYSAARGLLHRGIITELENVGRVMDQQVEREVALATVQMVDLSRALTDAMARGNAAELGEVLAAVQIVNPRLLQLRLVDPHLSVLAERSVTGVLDPMSRLAVGTALDAGQFVSDPFFPDAFKKYVLRIDVPVKSRQGSVIGVLGGRYDIQEALQSLANTARFNASGYAVVVSHTGRVVAHPDPKRINDDLSGYPAVKAGLAGMSGSLTARNNAGISRLFFYRPLKGSATADPKPLVLLTEIDNKEVAAMLQGVQNRFVIAALAVIVVCLILTRLLAGNIETPLVQMMSAARKIQEGDLTVEIKRKGVDEFGRLSGAVNAMVRGLRERETIKQVFGQYVASHVSEKVLHGEVALEGEARRVTILFSDIRNFTSMAERLSPLEVVRFLNDYFSEMVDAVFENEGMLDKFIGDGLMAIFGAIEDTPDHARKAVRAGLRMKALVAKINGTRDIGGLPPIAIGIGVHTDEVILGNIGSRKRLQYTAIGDGVNTCSRIESLNKELGTTLLVTEATYELIKGGFECRPAQKAAIRGKSEPIMCYEVLSERAQAV